MQIRPRILAQALEYQAAYAVMLLGGIGISIAILWPVLDSLVSTLSYLL